MAGFIAAVVVWEKLQPTLAGASWPPSLRRLAFGGDFNQPIAGVLWPASLHKLLGMHMFNQPIDGVLWPVSL